MIRITKEGENYVVYNGHETMVLRGIGHLQELIDAAKAKEIER